MLNKKNSLNLNNLKSKSKEKLFYNYLIKIFILFKTESNALLFTFSLVKCYLF